jgi:hypothetical protein
MRRVSSDDHRSCSGVSDRLSDPATYRAGTADDNGNSPIEAE